MKEQLEEEEETLGKAPTCLMQSTCKRSCQVHAYGVCNTVACRCTAIALPQLLVKVPRKANPGWSSVGITTNVLFV